MPSSAFLFNNIAEMYQFMPYFFNFLRSVPRLMPIISAARVWLPRVYCITMSNRGCSTSASTSS